MITVQTCTINQMLACMFDGAVMEGWDEVYVEFIDLSGLAQTDEYNLLVAKNNIAVRMHVIPQYVIVQYETLRVFNKYHPIATAKLSAYGYKMPNDVSKAKAALDKVMRKEKRWLFELRSIEDRLAKLHTHTEDNDNKRARRSFIKMINSVGQHYRIDRDKTTVEEFALMVREMKEQADLARVENGLKSR